MLKSKILPAYKILEFRIKDMAQNEMIMVIDGIIRWCILFIVKKPIWITISLQPWVAFFAMTSDHLRVACVTMQIFLWRKECWWRVSDWLR